MAHVAQTERAALCSLLLEVGPEAPTLCEGWTTADLAAHLVLRERRPDAAVGIVVGPLAGHTESVQRRLRTLSWPRLVDTVRGGPPLLLRPVDELMNTVEYFVHHEDVRRAVPGWEPRRLDPSTEQALGKRLGLLSRMAQRRAPVPMVLRPSVGGPDGGTGGTAGGGGTADGGGGDEGGAQGADGRPGAVTVAGPPSELVLFLSGRQGATRVELLGDPDAVERLRSAGLGL